MKGALVEGAEAALALGELDKAEQLLAIPESLDPGQRMPYLGAQAARLRARFDGTRGSHDQVAERFRAAAALSREFGFLFHLAVTQLEHAEWLTGRGRAEDARALLEEARETFERLQARPWLERLAAAQAARPAEIPA